MSIDVPNKFGMKTEGELQKLNKIKSDKPIIGIVYDWKVRSKSDVEI